MAELAELACNEHQMEILNPDLGVIATDLLDRLGVRAIDLLIAGPFVVDVAHATEEPVQERPQALVAEPGVEPLAPGRRIVELRARDRIAVLEPDPQAGLALEPAPAEPDAVSFAQCRRDRRDQPADFFAATRGEVRQPVRDDDELRVAPRRIGLREREERRGDVAALPCLHQPREERVDRCDVGEPKRRTGQPRLERDEDAEILIAQRHEHVLIGRVVTDREHHRIRRASAAQPAERDPFVRRAMANLDRLDDRQALELAIGLEPFVDKDLGRARDRRVLGGANEPPVQADRARFTLDDRALVARRERSQRAFDLVELRHRWQRGFPHAIAAAPHAVLGRERDIRESRGQVLHHVARPTAHEAERHAGRARECVDERRGVAIDLRVVRSRGERDQGAIEIERDHERGRGREIMPINHGGSSYHRHRL